jgi:soluble lytic murein transglycosylase-like protein
MKNSQYLGWSVFFGLSMIYLTNWSLVTSRQKFLREIESLSNIISELENKNDTNHQKVTNLTFQLDVIDNAIQLDNKIKVRVELVRKAIKESNVSKLSITETNTLANEIIINSEKFDVEPALLLAIIRQESAFDVQAESRAGAKGLMQVLPSTANDIKGWLNKSYYNPHKIAHNVQFGTYYLAKLLHEYDFKMNNAIMAYNAGPEAVKRFLAGEIKKLPSETIDYEQKVIKYYKEYKNKGII